MSAKPTDTTRASTPAAAPTASASASALARAARRGAARAAREAGGGVALVFAAGPDATAGLQLRSAAGFEGTRAAREAGRVLVPPLLDCLGEAEARRLPAEPSLGPRAAAGLLVHPLAASGRLHGALVVGLPAEPDPSREAAIADVAADLTLGFECAELRDEVCTVRARLGHMEGSNRDTNEEILKLSEALFAQDIELLKNNERLGTIEKLKNDFIEKMSRELRTPLNGIIEAIIFVLTGEDDALSASAKSTLRSALDDGTAFLRTLQNILDLWRIKQGELPVELHDVNVREVVEEAVFSVQDSIDGKPLLLDQHLHEPLPKIRTDLTKVSHILFLLLDNAVKFTPRGEIEISARVEDGRLTCSVRDTGIGICPDDQKLIFDEFFQVDDSGSEKARGAGLGLALVKDLVTLLEGSLMVESDVGRGTTIGFEIPVLVAGG